MLDLKQGLCHHFLKKRGEKHGCDQNADLINKE